MLIIIFSFSVFSSFFGILLSRLIVIKLLKKKNSFTDSLCSTKGNFNCDAVLESSLGKFSKNIHLGDVGLFYFSAQFLFLLLSLINNQSSSIYILFIPIIISFTTTLILLWYQWKVIKSWCKLCLLLTSVIWAQAVLVFLALFIKDPYWVSDYLDDLFDDKTTPSFYTGITCLAVSSAWLFIKPSIIKASEAENTHKQLTRWKNNVQLFQSVLWQQKKIDSQVWDDDFLLGNQEAPIKMIVAMNPYCPACGREYKVLAELFKMYRQNCCLVIRFGVNLSKTGTKNQAVQYLIHSYSQTIKEEQVNILSDWYASSDFNKLKNKCPNIDLQETSLLKKFEEWFAETKIQFTPTLFLNGYQFPQPYSVSDLKFLIPGIIKLQEHIPEIEKII